MTPFHFYIIIITKIHPKPYSMTDKPLFPFRKRLNTEVMTKTEIALQAVKRYEMQQSRINFNQMSKFNEKDLLNDLDNDYSQLTPHKKIDLDRTYNISLFTYCQEFYCLEMINYVFPMRVFIKNVRHDGILYIGYDQEYPGIYHENKFSIFETVGETDKNYDFKTVLNKDMLITLKNKGNKIVKYVYFTFIAGSSLLMFDFKVQFLGFARGERLLSEVKIKQSQKIGFKNAEQISIAPTFRQKTEPTTKNFKEFQRSKFPEISKVNNEKLVKLQQFQVFTEQMPKHYSKSTLSPSHKQQPSPRRMFQHVSTVALKQKSESLHILKRGSGKVNLIKGDVEFKLQEIKRNKQIFQIFREKDKQLRETASRCKRLIQNYQKAYNQQSVRKRKLNKDLTIIIYSLLYVSKIQVICQKKIKRDKMKFKVAYLCKKFVQKLKKKHQQTCKMLPYRYKRAIVEGISVIGLQSKLLSRHSAIKTSKIIKSTLQFLFPLISLSKFLSISGEYQNKVILIQKHWRSKYYNRIACLLQFIRKHVDRMLKEYPQLAIFHDEFYQKGVNKDICLGYIKDESEKYRLIYDSYAKKLEEREEMIDVNRNFAMQNSTLRSRLVIPKRPIKPMHRFYRNCDILKSMVRTWFQVELKKHLKKSSQKQIK